VVSSFIGAAVPLFVLEAEGAGVFREEGQCDVLGDFYRSRPLSGALSFVGGS
jgi:hypothetical protein